MDATQKQKKAQRDQERRRRERERRALAQGGGTGGGGTAVAGSNVQQNQSTGMGVGAGNQFYSFDETELSTLRNIIQRMHQAQGALDGFVEHVVRARGLTGNWTMREDYRGLNPPPVSERRPVARQGSRETAQTSKA